MYTSMYPYFGETKRQQRENTVLWTREGSPAIILTNQTKGNLRTDRDADARIHLEYGPGTTRKISQQLRDDDSNNRWYRQVQKSRNTCNISAAGRPTEFRYTISLHKLMEKVFVGVTDGRRGASAESDTTIGSFRISFGSVNPDLVFGRRIKEIRPDK